MRLLPELAAALGEFKTSGTPGNELVFTAFHGLKDFTGI